MSSPSAGTARSSSIPARTRARSRACSTSISTARKAGPHRAEGGPQQTGGDQRQLSRRLGVRYTHYWSGWRAAAGGEISLGLGPVTKQAFQPFPHGHGLVVQELIERREVTRPAVDNIRLRRARNFNGDRSYFEWESAITSDHPRQAAILVVVLAEARPGGETGRRKGLKILFPATGVWVQVPPRAPTK